MGRKVLIDYGDGLCIFCRRGAYKKGLGYPIEHLQRVETKRKTLVRFHESCYRKSLRRV